jgi:hypothetical protein
MLKLDVFDVGNWNVRYFRGLVDGDAMGVARSE